MTEPLTSSLNTVGSRIPEVVDHLHSRADYAKNRSVKRLAKLLTDYHLALKLLAAKTSPASDEVIELQRQTTADVLPQISALFDENMVMMRMGPLNTARTIAPAVAKAENRLLAELREAYEGLAASLGAPNAAADAPSDPSPAPSPDASAADDQELSFAVDDETEQPPALDFDAFKAETIDISPFDPDGEDGGTKATIYETDSKK